MKQIVLTVILFAVVLRFGLEAAQAGVFYNDGAGKEFWANSALIVARIVEVNPKGANGVLVLEVQAVAVTESLVPTTMTVGYRQFVDSALDRVTVDKDEIILAVICRTNNGWSIDTDAIGFMPSNCGALVVKGIDDPAIAPILEKVKKLREK